MENIEGHPPQPARRQQGHLIWKRPGHLEDTKRKINN